MRNFRVVPKTETTLNLGRGAPRPAQLSSDAQAISETCRHMSTLFLGCLAPRQRTITSGTQVFIPEDWPQRLATHCAIEHLPRTQFPEFSANLLPHDDLLLSVCQTLRDDLLLSSARRHMKICAFMCRPVVPHAKCMPQHLRFPDRPAHSHRNIAGAWSQNAS